MGRYTNDQQPKPQNPQNNTQHAHPPTHKASISFPQVSHYDEEDPTTPVLVYFHSHNNKSFKLELAPKISIADVKIIIEEKIGIKRDRQLLYLNGKNITQYGYIRLQSQSIIHISNSDEICGSNQEIHLKLTIINFLDQKQQKIYKKFIAMPNDLVSDFLLRLQKEINLMFKFTSQEVQYYLLESSRLLEKQKTFLQQYVTRQSEIICMITKNEIKTRFTNDTKEEILNDISELLGFNDEPENKTQSKQEEHSIRPRHSRQQIRNQSVQKETHQEQSNSQIVPNFKKKKATSKLDSFEDTPNTGLAKKLKSSRKKKDLDFLLNSQQKQKLFFQSPQIVKQQAKHQETSEEPSQMKEKMVFDAPKTAPQIAKVMPIDERRQIRREIEKLFDLGGPKTKPITSVENSDSKEQKKPISPPTEAPKPKQRMRLSMGSRPAFLDQLRNMNLQ